MRIKIARSWPELAAHRDAWASLLDRSSNNEPTLSPAWMRSWWQTFGGDDGRHLCAVLVFRGPELIGLAPVLIRRVWHRNLIPVRRVELLATGEREDDEICSDYLNIIAEAGKEPLIARSVVDALRHGTLGGWDELVFDYMDADSPMTHHFARLLRGSGFRVEQSHRRPSPYTTLPRTWDDYLAQLSSTGRYMMRRTLRDLGKWAGDDITVVRAENSAELAEGQKILVELHGQRWQQSNHGGVFRSTKFLAFHRRVMPELLASGNLDLMWLRCKGEAIASIYNVVWNNKVYFYQCGRRTDLPKKIRPGIAMHAYAIQHAIAHGRTLYDFLSGASRYKKQLSVGERKLLRLQATRPHSPWAAVKSQVLRGEDVLRNLRDQLRERRSRGERASGATDTGDGG